MPMIIKYYMNLSKKIEPHVILHLRINKEDIENYMNSKIQTDPTELNNSFIEPKPYDNKEVGFCINNSKEGTQISFERITNLEESKEESKEEIEECKEETEKTEYISYNKYNLDDVPHVNMDKVNNIPEMDVLDDYNCSDSKIKFINCMSEFADSNKRNEWLKSTTIWCGWCSHPFSGPPVSIPKWYVKKTFFVSGCYCSYSCASKHLFSRGDVNEGNKWKYYNLLHLLRKKIVGDTETRKIKLAPPREALKVFGGYLSIEEFRNKTKETNLNYKIYNILEPPMVSIIPSIEETTYDKNYNSDMRLLNTHGGGRAYGNMKYVAPKNESYHSSTRWGNNKPYIPIDEDRMKRAVKNLRVTRKVPLLDRKKTLLHYMDLKINNKRGTDV